MKKKLLENKCEIRKIKDMYIKIKHLQKVYKQKPKKSRKEHKENKG